MNNVMMIDGHKAVIQYDPETEMLRGEFIGLHREGMTSLQTFLEVCKEQGLGTA